MNINNPGFLDDGLKVFFLKILTNMITDKNLNDRSHGLPSHQWAPDYWNDHKEEVEKAQNFLDNCGAAQLIYQTLREPHLETRLNLTTECLDFMIAFLLGGNLRS
jgi:inositol 1,4,5-triphosphate receptor type 1/inositol 1,4,5-triphosphate receptor type 3